MDLLEYSLEKELSAKAPLAERMRPRTLSEFVGQKDLLGPDKILRKAIEQDTLTSLIFYGPPGTGKTALARVIAHHTRGAFKKLNAVMSGVSDIRRTIEEGKKELALNGRRTLLFIDEIHRFNKGQQDALLPAVEGGIVILIGATTENPYFTINSPLLSRSRICLFTPLGQEDIRHIIHNALEDLERGLKSYQPALTEDALCHLVDSSGGDARRALNALELAVATVPPSVGGERLVTLPHMEEALQKKHLRYDRDGDNHYDVISAFIKSIRGSDADAALYWLARMLEAGEDPGFICRRMMISAAEDIGNADPRGLQVAVAAAQAVQMIGLPEGRIPMAQAATYLASAPKSNAAYMGINAAQKCVGTTGSLAVPPPLRDTSYGGAEKLKHGQGYLYPHDYPGGYVAQDYLPQEVRGSTFYNPKEEGFEKTLGERLKEIRRKKNE
jgi:putative ATPase